MRYYNRNDIWAVSVVNEHFQTVQISHAITQDAISAMHGVRIAVLTNVCIQDHQRRAMYVLNIKIGHVIS